MQVGSAHPSDWNVKINLQLKSSFFQPIMNFPHKVFRGRFDPIRRYKTVNKSSTSETSSRDNRHMSHFRQGQRLLTPYQSSSQTIKSRISNTRPRPLIAYQSTSHHRAADKQTNHLRTIYTLSLPDLAEQESLYLFLHTDLCLFKNKRN